MPSTIYRRRDMIRAFARYMNESGSLLSEASEQSIELFLDGRRIGARTRYTWLSALACFYDHVVDEGHMAVNPVRKIRRPKLRRTLPRPIGDEDLNVALAASWGQHKVWLILAAYAGLRCAEIAGLHRDDILFDINRLRIVGKGGKERMVPMHPMVSRALAEWPRPRTNTAIFTRPSGGAWPADQLSREGSIHLHHLGVDATMHQLRHWFGTRTYAESKDIRVVQELMGHSSPTTTAIYTAFSDEDQEAAVMGLRHRGHLRATARPPLPRLGDAQTA